jgi:exodeoxyribonuclease VII large subunit
MIEPAPNGPARFVWGVAALLQAVSDALAGRFGACVVRGEISGFSRAASGHCYFNLKDAERGEGALRCALFRRAATLVDFSPADGQLAEVRGRLGVYGPRGELQLIVESMQRAGDGALYERFLRLRERLEAEGLFDPAVKRPLPAFPARIGVVTSPGAAALHDVLSCLARRAPHVAVIVYPVPVQGVEAPPALCAAIACAGERAEVDVLVVCRGGGSLEDLWAFNDERVVRAIRASPIRVACGIGHETDVTLADLAADLRAPTPTAAAELVAPARSDCLDALAARAARLRRRLVDTLDAHEQRLDRAALRLARPGDAARRQGERLGVLAHRLEAASHRWLESADARLRQLSERLRRGAAAQSVRDRARLDGLKGRLEALDPDRVLARGYALLTDAAGHAIASVAQVRTGETLDARLHDGHLDISVLGSARRGPQPP